ncbi:MAG: VOC family protein [Myxococcota bacterium]
MPANPPHDMLRITPNVFYDDPAAALDWLAKAFGFETRMSMPGPDGGVIHAEMQLADGVVMLSPTAGAEAWKSPKSLGGSVTQSLYVYVDDVDAHCAVARSAGAKILSEPEDMFWGDRTYVAEDLEGHRWSFAVHVRDVAPKDVKPPA